jgi:hypothetical protein
MGFHEKNGGEREDACANMPIPAAQTFSREGQSAFLDRMNKILGSIDKRVLSFLDRINGIIRIGFLYKTFL